MSRIKVLLLTVAAASGLALLAGCGDDSEQVTRTEPVQQTEPPSNDANAGQPE